MSIAIFNSQLTQPLQTHHPDYAVTLSSYHRAKHDDSRLIAGYTQPRVSGRKAKRIIRWGFSIPGALLRDLCHENSIDKKAVTVKQE
jgi:hypothetical protein